MSLPVALAGRGLRLALYTLLTLLTPPVSPAESLPPSRVAFTNEHIDLRITYTPGEAQPLNLVIRNSDLGVNLPANEVVLVAAEPARLELPPGFDVFGMAGDPFWILPQSQDPLLLYLGFSAEGLPQGIFEPRFDIQLVRLDGPGHFFVWQANSFGEIDMRMNSRDGIGIEDRVRPMLGGHDHYNFGFTAGGLYSATFQAIARGLGSDVVWNSPEIPVLFAVLPLPELPTTTPTLGLPIRQPDSGTYRVTISGTVPGRSYRIEESSDLRDWEPADSVAGLEPGQPDPSFRFRPTGGGKHFRVVLLP
jgi:hypothetical protein